ncbi:hypothetical protein IT157_09950, partial [bacterium]|nr:hypothetical protein [bacterium]
MNTWKMMFVLMTLAILGSAWASDRNGPSSLDDRCVGDATLYLDDNSQTSEVDVNLEGNDCGRTSDPDYIWRLVVASSGLWTIKDDYNTARLYLLTGCCDGDQIFPRGRVEDEGRIECIFLEQGEYFLVAEGDDDVLLMITPCEDPCVTMQMEDGIFYEGVQGMYVQTTDASSPENLYDGPWQMQGTPCQDETVNEEGAIVGFGYYNWYNQDFGWNHIFTTENFECLEYVIDSACVLICAYEVDACVPSREHSNCEFDIVRFDGGDNAWPHLNPDAEPGDNLSNSVTRIPVPLSALEDGDLNVDLDIDAYSDECAWATTVKWSQLVVYFTCSQTPPQPLGFDLGDLPPFDDLGNECYPTASVENGGPGNAVFAPEDQVAWLGECVDFEQVPVLPDNDDCDDGIDFIPGNYSGGSWMPCETACVDVTVSTGPAYEQGTPLYIWAWKDGNLDCDFDDIYLECMEGDDT